MSLLKKRIISAANTYKKPNKLFNFTFELWLTKNCLFYFVLAFLFLSILDYIDNKASSSILCSIYKFSCCLAWLRIETLQLLAILFKRSWCRFGKTKWDQQIKKLNKYARLNKETITCYNKFNDLPVRTSCFLSIW